MNKWTIVKTPTIAAAAVSFGTAASAQTRGVTATEVTFGMHTDLSGVAATYGVSSSNGVKMRFDEINEAGGINGRKLRVIVEDQLKRGELRRMFGMVLQDTWLFSGTIRDNIAYGRKNDSRAEAGEDAIVFAAKAAQADHFHRTLPDTYETMINEGASNLSEGQKQLLTIARAFLAEPTILVLDEATSSVDTRTEFLVQHAMAALRSQRTSFVIAHRLSTIRDADTILVMDAGQIVEQGSHRELLARQGAYFTLYHAQFAGALVDDEDLEVSGSAGPG